MPVLTVDPGDFCSERRPCGPHGDRCGMCEARTALEPDDWTIVGFFRRVAGQYINQTPMGAGEGKPPVLTFSVAGCRAALECYRYPAESWPLLTDGAALLHGLVRDQTEVDWHTEVGKPYMAVGLDDVRSLTRREALPLGLVDLEV